MPTCAARVSLHPFGQEERLMKRSWMLASVAALVMAIGVEARATPVDAGPAPLAIQAPVAPALLLLQDPPPAPKPDVDVQVSTERTVWYADPVWIGVGLIAAAIVIALIVAASRRDTTTVVR
jgi:hypothetical protein